MTKGARSTWRRRSPTARITSSSDARSGKRLIRKRSRKRSSRRSRLFFLDKLFQQALQMLVVRQHHAVEQRLFAAAHEDRREVLDLDVLHRLGVLLDVDPAELRARKALGHAEEAGAVGDAGVAP